MSLEVDLQAELDLLRGRLSELEARLRRSHKSGRAPGSEVEVLFTRVGQLAAAFELEAVREVVPAAELAPLPEAPSWVLGTLNLRGTTLPVIDIASRFGRSTRELGVTDLIVVVSTEFGAAGLVVDEVGIIATVRLDEEVSLLETSHASYVVGTFSHAGHARLLLGVQELLRHSEVATLLSAAREARTR